MSTNAMEKISNIAKDFDIFCNYIDNNRVKLTNKREIGRKDLFEINKSLYFKSDVSSPNYPQKSYELINLLFHVCKNSKLYRISGDPNRNTYLVRTNRMADVDKLNGYEKYVFLLETYFIYFKSKDFGNNCSATGIDEFIEMISLCTSEETADGDWKETFRTHTSKTIMSHMHFFGICDYKVKNGGTRKEKREGRQVTINEFSVFMCKFLNDKRRIVDWNEDLFDIDDVLEQGEPFSYAFKDIFKKNMEPFVIEKYKKGNLKGSYVFRIRLNNKWTEINLSYKSSLEELHLAIQEILCFNDDHTYSFYMDGILFSDDYYNHSIMDSGPYAEDVEIGKLGLYIWQNFVYFLECGDSWSYGVQLVDVIIDEE